MKKIYERPEIEINKYSSVDVVSASANTGFKSRQFTFNSTGRNDINF